jgi:hypothetical protein
MIKKVGVVLKIVEEFQSHAISETFLIYKLFEIEKYVCETIFCRETSVESD